MYDNVLYHTLEAMSATVQIEGSVVSNVAPGGASDGRSDGRIDCIARPQFEWRRANDWRPRAVVEQALW